MGIIYNREPGGRVVRQRRRLNAWIKQVAEGENSCIGDIAIITCSDDYIISANRQFLGHDYYTDIITFDYSEGEILSGDLLISTDTVKSNAVTYGVMFHVELHRVIIHGVLHLMGYKDKRPADAKIMRQREDEALGLLYGALDSEDIVW